MSLLRRASQVPLPAGRRGCPGRVLTGASEPTVKFEGLQKPTDAAVESSGTVAEADALGVVNTEDPKYRTAAEAWYAENEGLVRKFNERRLSVRERAALFGSSFSLIENLPENRDHPERATNPETQPLRDLRLAVAEGLEFVTDMDMERVKIFTAVGSPIDKQLGIDGFIRIDGPDVYQSPVFVSFDYTTNPHKDKTRADVLIRRLPDPDLAETDYIAAVDRAGAELVNEYRRKLLLRQRPQRR